jgi:alanine racemase
MGRIGLRDAAAVKEAVRLIEAEERLLLVGVYTHLACADEADPGYTQMQVACFNQLLAEVPDGPIVHAANSAGALARPSTYYDMVRIGISLYGIYPSDEVNRSIDLKPALSWKTKVIHLKEVPAGAGISYGATYRTSRVSWIATLPVGYADGYPRLLSNQGTVVIKGCRVPVVGRVCMDQMMVDVTGLENRIRFGDEAVLIGRQGDAYVTADELAAKAKTIPYEIVTGIGKRVPRIYPGSQS